MKSISYIKKLQKNFEQIPETLKKLNLNSTQIDDSILNNIDDQVSKKITKNDLPSFNHLRQIKVTTPADGETVTATKGNTVLTQNSTNKQCVFDIPSYGDWTIKKGSNEAVVSVNELKQYIPKFGFSDYTWQEINDISEAGQAASKFKIGDEKDVTLTTGEVLTFQIYDFNHDDLQSGGKAGITLGMKNLMATKRRMEATDTNVNSFIGSEMYKWLNGECFNSLPNDLKSLIKPVNKKTSAGNTSAAIRTDAMKLWLFSENEVFGTKTNSTGNEGTKYPIFTTNNSRIKKLSNGSGSAEWWWLRSPYAVISSIFCNVDSDGTAYYDYASYASGVCFGFSI